MNDMNDMNDTHDVDDMTRRRDDGQDSDEYEILGSSAVSSALCPLILQCNKHLIYLVMKCITLLKPHFPQTWRF